MPYPNEYAARINNPDKYSKIRRENNKFGQGIDVVWGILPSGDTEVQAIRFSKSHTSDEVHAWLKAHKYSPIEFSAPTNNDGAESNRVTRFDSGSILKMEKTAEGFIKGTARVTRTGIFTYRKADGTVRKELRHPNDVFSLDSLSSMKMIPITNLHPASKLITVDNAKELAIGYTGETVKPDGKFVTVPIAITTTDGIAAVEGGRKELSLGYEVELEETPGRYDGEDYDCVQKNITYNHLAIVDVGRAGQDVRLNLDANDAEEIISVPTNNKQPSTRGDTMVKIKLDSGLEYEAAPEVAVAFTALQTKLDAVNTELTAAKKETDKLKADADTAKETATQMQKKLDEMPAALAAAMKARIALVQVANDNLDEEAVKKLDTMSDNDIKTAIILSRFPEAKLDGKSQEYIDARFDAAVEIKLDDESAAAQRATAIPRTDGKSAPNPDANRQAMIERMKAASQDGCGESKEKK
jgi:hypothetical protein